MNRLFAVTPIRAATLGLALALSGCSSIESFLAGDKVDYRSQAGKTAPLEVPPDLTQLARDARYQPQSGTVSANAMQHRATANFLRFGIGSSSGAAPLSSQKRSSFPRLFGSLLSFSSI